MDLSLFQKNILNASSGWAYFLEKNSENIKREILFIRQKQSLGKSSYEKIKSDWLYTCRNLFPYMDFYGYTPIDSSIFKEIFFLKEKYRREILSYKEKIFSI